MARQLVDTAKPSLDAETLSPNPATITFDGLTLRPDSSGTAIRQHPPVHGGLKNGVSDSKGLLFPTKSQIHIMKRGLLPNSMRLQLKFGNCTTHMRRGC